MTWEDSMNEDSGFDLFLEEMYEDRYAWEDPRPDYDIWEESQLALDNDWDEGYDEDEDGEYDPDPDYGEPPF